MRDGSPDAQAALARPGRYQTVRDNLRVKDVRLGDGDTARALRRLPQPRRGRTRQGRARRAARPARGRARPDRDRPPQGEDEQGAARRTRAPSARCATTRRSRATCARPPSGRLLIDRAKVAAEERLDGKYLLSTSDPDLSAEEIALGYKNLREAERSFRDLKTTLELRPVFHRLEHRIRAHVLVCWLALLLIRVAERHSGQTWRRIATELQRLHLVTLQGAAGTVEQTTPPTDAQRAHPRRARGRAAAADHRARARLSRPPTAAHRCRHTPTHAANAQKPCSSSRFQPNRVPINCGTRVEPRAGFADRSSE